MAEKLAEGLWRLDIPLPGSPLKNLNSYLIKGERSLLVDTGFPFLPCRQALESQLQELHVDRSKLDFFLTHAHQDHIGLIADLAQEESRIYISRIDEALARKSARPDYWQSKVQRTVQNGFPAWEMQKIVEGSAKVKRAVWPGEERCSRLEDGDTIEYGGHKLTAILTPGHTPGHMCLYEPDLRWLFAGDHILFHISPNICRYNGVEDSLGDYLDSLRRIRGLPVSLLLPAHRQTEGTLEQRVNELLEHHEKRLTELRGLVLAAPGLNAYELASRLEWHLRGTWEIYPAAQKYFATGEVLAHLDYLEKRALVTRFFSDDCFRYSCEDA